MDTHIPELAASNSEPVIKHNRGWFRPGDPRINRSGRPSEARAAARREQPLSGKLMTLLIPESHLRQYLTGRDAPWLKNLPRDFQLIDLYLDRARKEAVA